MKFGIVVLDTLRQDTFNQECLDVQRRAAHTFENMYSTSRWTVPAHASLFTGLFPTEAGTTAKSRILTSRPVLAEQFADRDYQTVAVNNNPNLDTHSNFDRGFETFHRGPALTSQQGEFDWTRFFAESSDGPLRYIKAVREIVQSDAPTLNTLLSGIKMAGGGSLNTPENTRDIDWAYEALDTHPEFSDDLFLFGNFMTCHYPYSPPDEYLSEEPYLVKPLELTLREEPVERWEHNRHRSCYEAAASYLDDALERIIEAVDWDVLFILSDHGELFGECELYGHEFGMYEDLVHVPAVAFGSEVPEGHTESLTSILDVHRTLCEIADIEPPKGARGVNLFNDIPHDRTLYAESTGNFMYSPDAVGTVGRMPEKWGKPHYMIRTEDSMFIADSERTQAFDMPSNEPNPSKLDELQTKADAIRDERIEPLNDTDSSSEDLPDEVEQRLEQLGYK